MPVEQCDVVHVVNQMRPGGIETMVVDLVSKSRHASRIFSLESTKSQLIADWPQLAALADRLDAFERPPRLDLRLIMRVASRLRQLRPHTIFLHRTNPLLYGGVAARLARVPRVVHVEHDVWHYSDPGRRRLLRIAANLVRPLHFAVSQAVADKLLEMLPAQKVNVVPGGVDLQRFASVSRNDARLALGLQPGARVVGSVGRLEEVKGHRILIESMAQLPADISVILVGEGSQRERLMAQAAALGVDGRLRLLGHRDDIERILPAFDVFCLPSVSEGLPRVVMEAQGAGVPVVATDVGSVRQAIDPKSGRVIRPQDPVAMAQALAAVLEHPPDTGACRRFAEANFSIGSMVLAYDDLTPDRAVAAPARPRSSASDG